MRKRRRGRQRNFILKICLPSVCGVSFDTQAVRSDIFSYPGYLPLYHPSPMQKSMSTICSLQVNIGIQRMKIWIMMLNAANHNGFGHKHFLFHSRENAAHVSTINLQTPECIFCTLATFIHM